MTSWFKSHGGVSTLSLIALITLLARSYYDTRYILVEEYSSMAPEMDTLWIIGFTLIVGGYAIVLFETAKRAVGPWMIALLIYNLLIGLGFGAAYLLKPPDDDLAVIIITANLVAGLLAAAAIGFRLYQKQPIGSKAA